MVCLPCVVSKHGSVPKVLVVVQEIKACNIFTSRFKLYLVRRNDGSLNVESAKREFILCPFYNCLLAKINVRIRTFRRTVDGPDKTFDDEPILPALNNLSSHATVCQKKQRSNDTDDEVPLTTNLKRSAELMAQYLREGELNPAVVPTQRGFLRLFSAWILDESLPWTTGEAPTLRLLFKYLKINFMLPSDTTVRNQLGHIFGELHSKVVREFTVSMGSAQNEYQTYLTNHKNVKSKIAYATDTWTTKQMVYTFACTIGTFIDDDWNIIERVVDFHPLESHEHEGIHAGKAFVDGAAKCGGLKKISTLLLFSPVLAYLCVPLLLKPLDGQCKCE